MIQGGSARRARDLAAILRESDDDATVKQDPDGGLSAQFRPDEAGPIIKLAIGSGRSPILEAIFGIYPERCDGGTGAHP